MTPAELALYRRVLRLTRNMQPNVSRAILQGFDAIRGLLSDRDIQTFLAEGNIERLLGGGLLSDDVLDKAFSNVSKALREGVATAADSFGQSIDKSIGFDILNPRIIDAVRVFETRVIKTLKDDTKEVLKAYTEDALQRGVGPRVLAQHVRDVVGLAPNQEQAVRNFQRMLENGGREALTRSLRDKRFDGVLERSLGKDGLSSDQIARYTDAYRRKMIAFNAETQSRTASLDAQKLGQHLSYQDAVDKGVIPAESLMKSWSGTLDGREREEHLAMQDETVPWDQPFSNGEVTPGESTYNCRCNARYFVQEAA